MRPATLSKPSYESVVSINHVLRKTYLLLSLTLLFSAGMAYFAIIKNAAPMNIFLLIAGMFGLYFLTTALSKSHWGLLAIFLYTGFMGYTLGPILNFYIHGFNNGSQIVTTALGSTGILFLGLSGYVLITRKDFSYLGGFLAASILIVLLGGIASLLLQLPVLSVLISGAFALISSAFILYTTSQIINGGERNYIMATISLYLAIFNLFVSLLRILSYFTGNRN